MASSTRSQVATQTEAYEHLIGNVFNWEGSTPAVLALEEAEYNSMTDLVSMSKEEINAMKYNAQLDPDMEEDIKPVPMKQRKLLTHALLYFEQQSQTRTNRTVTPEDWLNLTKLDFEAFRVNDVPILLRDDTRRRTTSGLSTTTGILGNVTSANVQAFEYTHRRDIKSYAKFNGQLKTYFRTIRQWKSQARVDGVSRVFEETTIIPALETEDFRLWEKQQAFVMSVLNSSITQGQAHTILRRYADEGNAHQVLLDIYHHYTADGNISTLRTDFHRAIAQMQLTTKTPGGATKFLQEFQSMYLDLEEATKVPIVEEEKFGMLAASCDGHPAFSNTIKQLTLIAESRGNTISYATAIQTLVREAEQQRKDHVRRLSSQDYSSRNIQTDRQGSNGSRGGRGRRGSGRGRGKGRSGRGGYSDFLPKAQYDLLTDEEKKLRFERRLTNREIPQTRSVNSQSTANNTAPTTVSVPTGDASVASSIYTHTVPSVPVPTPNLRHIMASQATPTSSETQIIQGSDGQSYALR